MTIAAWKHDNNNQNEDENDDYNLLLETITGILQEFIINIVDNNAAITFNAFSACQQEAEEAEEVDTLTLEND